MQCSGAFNEKLLEFKAQNVLNCALSFGSYVNQKYSRGKRMTRTLITRLRAIALMLLAALAFTAEAASLKLVIHEEAGSEGEPLPPLSRFNALKRSLETALGRPVEITITRDRLRVYEWMERNPVTCSSPPEQPSPPLR